MKTAAEYLQAVQLTPSWLDAFDRPVVREREALAAVQAALDDAAAEIDRLHRYRHLLTTALFRATPPPPPTP